MRQARIISCISIRPGDTAGTTASDAVTKWHALEDAAAHVDAATVADQSLTHDTQTHTADGWLL